MRVKQTYALSETAEHMRLIVKGRNAIKLVFVKTSVIKYDSLALWNKIKEEKGNKND